MSNLKYTSVTVNLTNHTNKKTIDFVSSGYTLFFNAQHLLIQLSANERAYFDFLCEKMTAKNNYITVNIEMKEAFIDHIDKITSGANTPSLASVTRYTSKLAKLNLLILMGTKMSEFYSVNPKYVFKGAAKQRVIALRKLIEHLDNNSKSIHVFIGS